MSDFICQFCNHAVAINNCTRRTFLLDFTGAKEPVTYSPKSGNAIVAVSGKTTYSLDLNPELIEIIFFKCPHCEQFSIKINGFGEQTKGLSTFIRPSSPAKKFPEYIPQFIRDDYEEACAIAHLSPKASATLSRRCLQNMIRDFWGISKKRLVDEISELQTKVPAAQWKVIDSLRRIGNIGAHPEADVNLIIDINPEDAQKLLKVIELLLNQWYIERHEQESLYEDISKLDEAKQDERHPKS